MRADPESPETAFPTSTPELASHGRRAQCYPLRRLPCPADGRVLPPAAGFVDPSAQGAPHRSPINHPRRTTRSLRSERFSMFWRKAHEGEAVLWALDLLGRRKPEYLSDKGAAQWRLPDVEANSLCAHTTGAAVRSHSSARRGRRSSRALRCRATALLGDGLMPAPPEVPFDLLQLRSHPRRYGPPNEEKLPDLAFPQMCVKPRRLKLSGFPRFRSPRRSAA